MSDLPQISEAEFKVMKVIWKYAPISTNEITDRLTKSTSWSPKTIQTLIKRLVTKKVLSYEKQGRVFVYTPLVNEKDYVSRKADLFCSVSMTAILPPCFQLILKMNGCQNRRLILSVPFVR